MQRSGGIALSMSRRHLNDLAAEQIETAVDGDSEHRIAPEVAIAGSNESGHVARAAQSQHGGDRSENSALWSVVAAVDR